MFNRGALTITASTLTGNTADFAGGGILNSGTLTLTESTISGNTAGEGGGGIYNVGELTVTASTISGNTAGEGGGIANDGTATVMQSTISGNTARYNGYYGYGYSYGSGGGIGNSGALTVTQSTISGNTAGEEGGGIGNEGSLTVIASTISGNSAGYNAGGIGNSYFGTATVLQSTISGNSAGYRGGGIGNDGELTVGQSTITGNSAGFSGGGGLAGRYGSVTLTNSIVAGNTAGGSASDIVDFGHYYEDGFFGFTLSLNTATSVNNLIGDANTSGGLLDKSDDALYGNIVGIDGEGTLPISNVLFPVLVANGGPTLTHPLMPDSLALDAGAVLTTLASSITTGTDSQISVSNAALIPVGTLIQIEAEILSVISKTGNTLGVTRGESSTTATAHLEGASVQFAFDQRGDGFSRVLNSTVDIGAVEGTASDTFVAITVSPTSVLEGQGSDGANLVYQFLRSDKGDVLSVDFSVSGTATLTNDYAVTGANSFSSTSGSVTFAAGSATASVTVNPTQDLAIEFHETVVLTLLGDPDPDPDYTLSSTTIATGTIEMDEPLIVNTLADLDDNDFEADNGVAGDGLFSLREAIRVASTLGDYRSISFAESLFSSGAKTLVLSAGELLITGSTDIVGPGAELLTIDANCLSRIFHMDGDLDNDGQADNDDQGDFDGGGEEPVLLNSPDGDFSGLVVTMTGLTLTGGNATDGGAIWNEFGHLEISHSVLTENTAEGRGGAIFTQAGGDQREMNSLYLDDVIVSDNEAEMGGGIYNLNDHVEITDSVIERNTAAVFGGGIYTSAVRHDFIDGDGGDDSIIGGGGGGEQTLILNGTSVINNHATNGDGGGIYSDHDYVRFNNETEVSGNTSGGNGGGIYLDGNSLSIFASAVVDNEARNGGGIYIENTSSEEGYAQLTITFGSEIRDNTASALPGQSAQGGGIFSRADGVYLFDATISGNEAKGGDATEELAAGFAEGGGIYHSHAEYGYFSMNGNDISDNHAKGGHALGGGSGGNAFGGGFYTRGYLTAFENTFSNNSATGGDGTAPGEGQGGGLWFTGDDSYLTLGSSTVSGNQATGGSNTNPELNGGNGSGGGLFSTTNTSVAISTFSNNTAIGGQGASPGLGNGGGISSVGGFLGLFEVTLNGNQATQDGGGLFTISNASIDDSTFWGNSAVNGGGIWNSGDLYALQLTLSGNRATNDGGGLHNIGIAESSINSSTITDNHADSDNSGSGTGGGVWHRTDSVTTEVVIEGEEYEFTETGRLDVFSSIIAGNFQGTDVDPENPNDDPAHNDTVYDVVNVDQPVYGSFIGGDPELGPLQDNGGTTLTHEPYPDSPVVDPVDGTYSDPFATDQRGRPRVVGDRQDFGSVEVQQLQDYGDAPMFFGTVQTYYYYGPYGAASHSVGTGDSLRLGELIDVEDDGQPNTLALGDDDQISDSENEYDDDEDGVFFTSATLDGKPNLVVGTTVTVTVFVNNVDSDRPAYLNAWVDFNGDGYFQDYYGSEQIFDSVNVTAPGVDLSEEDPGIQLSFLVPGSAGTNARTYARFRLSTEEDLLSYGAARDGEVEDYVVSTSGISAHVDDTDPDSEGGWNIQVAPDSGDFSFAGGLFSWNRDFSTDEDNPNHMAQQWFWYRIGETGPELGLDSLALISANSHATNDELGANTIELVFGSPDTDEINANDPIQVKVTYVLSGAHATQSTITETVEIKNISGHDLDLHWFEFTDLDVDGQRYDNKIVSAGVTGITQSGPLGSDVTVAVINGPTPDRYQVEDFRTYGPTGRYGNTRLGMIDHVTTDLTNVAPDPSVSGDFVQAFQWDFSSSDEGTKNSVLEIGGTRTITKTKSGTFAEVALPESTTTDGGSAFNDPSPPPGGSGFQPKWYDPAIAIGYDYVVTGARNFAELALPAGFSDSLYTLHLPNGDGYNEAPDATLRGGDITGDNIVTELDVYDFINGFTVDANGYLAVSGTTIPGVAGGRTSIRILGIEPGAEVDPANPVGFPTGFTFTGTTGAALFTQTGIAETIYVDNVASTTITDGMAGDYLVTNDHDPDGPDLPGVPNGLLDAGDKVTWLGSAGDADDVTGLIFGATAFASVQSAVNAVVYSGTSISVAPGTFTENVTVDRSLSIVGASALTTIINGNASGSVFQINAGVTVNLSGLKITNGSAAAGGGILNQGTLNLTDSIVTGNTAQGANGTNRVPTEEPTTGGFGGLGGGLFNSSTGTMTVTRSTISDNLARGGNGGVGDGGNGGGGGGAGMGGGLFNLGGVLTITESSVTNNDAQGGNGSIGAQGGGGGAGLGAGIFNSSGTVTISNSTISGNEALGGNGGGEGFGGAPPGTGTTGAFGQGGGGAQTGGAGGFGGGGGGGGSGSGVGGTGGDFGGGGGGASVGGSGGLGGGGGAGANGGGGGGGGGGIFNNGATSLLTIRNSTTVFNSVGGGSGAESGQGIGGNVFTTHATATVSSSIIAKGTAGGDPDDVSGSFTSGGFNLIGLLGTATGFTDGLLADQVGTAATIDPRLGSLANNGGLTQTFALLSDSPAIDKGKRFGGITTDQRGTARPYDFDEGVYSNASGGDGSDIGAFELTPVDFGDAPSDYPSASHAAGGPRLGALVDFESSEQASDNANLDDTTDIDDEDGVAFISGNLLRLAGSNTTASVLVNVTQAAGKLDAWIDFDHDGNWNDAGEQIFANQSVTVGNNVLNFTVPSGAYLGNTTARFRLSTVGGLSVDGLSADGEVEDYQVALVDADGAYVVLGLPPASGTTEVLLSGADLVVRQGDLELLRVLAGQIYSLEVNGTAGDFDDVLLISAPLANPIPEVGGLAFHGGTGGSDALRISGNALAATYTPDVSSNGNGSIAFADSGTLNFTGLEPIEFNVGGGTFNLNLNGFTDEVTISESTLLDGTTAALKISGTTGEFSFEHALVRGSAISINTELGGSDGGEDEVTITSANNKHANPSLTINTDFVEINGAATFSDAVSITTESIAIAAVLTSKEITLQPGSSDRSIGLGNDAVGDFKLTTTELTNLSASKKVTIGASLGTGLVDLRTVDLSGEEFDLTLIGGATTFNGGLTLPSGKTLTLTTGAITSPNTGTDVTIAGSSTLNVTASGVIGASDKPLTMNVATLVTDTNGDADDFAQFLSEANSVSIGGADLDAGTATITLVSGTFLTSASGFIKSPLSLAGGTLGGVGEVLGAVSMTAAGGKVTPGTSPGQLTVNGNVTLNAAGSFDVDLDGKTVGSGYDQLKVTGTDRDVTLSGAKLNLSFGGDPAFVPDTGDKFTVIDNVASTSEVIGTFKDSTGTTLAEGSGVVVSGNHFVITYIGGTNSNDVVLTADQTPPTVTINIEDGSLSDTDNASNVTFVFSENPGTSFVLGDISATNGAMIDLVKDDATHYHATFTATNGIEDTGSVTVNADKFTDAALNNNLAADPDTVTIDTKNPTVTITDDEEVTTARYKDGTITYTFTFSETVSDFTVSDVVVVNGTAAEEFATDDGKVFTLVVTPAFDVLGDLTVNVAADKAYDSANNPNTAAEESTQPIDTRVVTVLDAFALSRVTFVMQLPDPDDPDETITVTASANGFSEIARIYLGENVGDAQDLEDDENDRDEILTELVQLNLTGTHPQLGDFHITLIPRQPSVGMAEETENNAEGILDVAPHTEAGSIDSFFDVFVTIETEVGMLHTTEPMRLSAAGLQNAVPDRDDTFGLQGGSIELVDEEGETVGQLNDVDYIPGAMVDFGDAPNDYGTSLNFDDDGHDGAHHETLGPRLGTLRDADTNGPEQGSGLNDDDAGDDEDGVDFSATALVSGFDSQVLVTASAAGYVNAWFDFNGDGDFGEYDAGVFVVDADEQIFKDKAVVEGTNTLSFTVPEGLEAGTTFARFRITSATNKATIPHGFAPDGEVEDYGGDLVIQEALLPDLDIDPVPTDLTFFFSSLTTAPQSYDPAIAIGYDFAVYEEAPNFKTIRLPVFFDGDGNPIGNNSYELHLADGEGFSDQSVATLLGGEEYDFTTDFGEFEGNVSGLSRFRIRGVDREVGVDPADAMGFNVIFSFLEDGEDGDTFTMTGIPLTVYVDQLADFVIDDTVPFDDDADGDNDDSGDVSVGDFVIWRSGQGDEVKGLIFGNTAFAAVQSAIDFVEDSDYSGLTTIQIAPGTFFESLTITGDGIELVGAGSTGAAATITILDGGDEVRVVDIDESAVVRITGVKIQNGLATDGEDESYSDSDLGGGIRNLGGLTLVNSVVTGNVAAADGGGIFSHSDGTVTITNTSISENTSGGYGGGMFSLHDTLTITNSTIDRNDAGSNGGGLFIVEGDVTVISSTISGNTADGDGGGIFNYAYYGDSTLTVTNSTISGNTATGGSGGGIFNYADDDTANATITNSTISGNTAGNSGGGIYNGQDSGDGNLVVRNSTITGNRASSGNAGASGGGIAAYDSETLENSIVAGNFRGSVDESESNDISGDINDASHNLIGDPDSSGGITHGGEGGNIVGQADGEDRVLLDITTVLDTTLRNNGGLTLTHALQPGSLAIDNGDNELLPDGLEFDQRGAGFPRVVKEIVDIGAFEFRPFDFGDAPDIEGKYPTLFENDGARHVVVNDGPRLGEDIDDDEDGASSATANGDDTLDDSDDEDGVIFGALRVSAVAARTASVTVFVSNAPEGALLDAWLDFNQDGDWDEDEEQIFTNEEVENGPNDLEFTIPAGATLGSSFARFRISTAGDLAPTGSADDGEVEDYAVTLVPELVRVKALLGILYITDNGGLSNDISVTLDTAPNPDVYVVSSPRAELTTDGINGVKEVRILKSEVNVGIKANLGDGNDSLKFDKLALSATVHGGTGKDTILAGSGKDQLFGDAGDDLVRGGAGDDLVSGGAGTDVVHGDAGTDTQREDTDASSVVVSRTAITGAGSTDDEEEAFGIGIEKVWIVGGDGENSIDASLSSRPVTLDGAGGNDVLLGSNGHDVLEGGADDDQFTGNAGNDVLNGGEGDDTLIEMRNANFTLTDISLVGNGTDKLNSLEVANLIGGSGANTFTVSGWTGLGSFNGAGGKDTIVAVKNVATFNLSDANLATSDGMDLLLDGFNKANLTGGASVNVFIVSEWHGTGTINGSGGTDRIEATRDADLTLTNSSLATAGSPTFGVLSLASVETANLSGGDSGNKLNAKSFTLGAVTLQGHGGKDELTGGSKNDVLIGGDGEDLLTGGGGRDLLIGGTSKDTFKGEAGDDILIGGTTDHSDDIAALNAIMAEWGGANAYAARIAKLRDTGVLNGTIKLNEFTVQNDYDVADSLTGGADRDWFFKSANDVLDAVLVGSADKLETVTTTPSE